MAVSANMGSWSGGGKYRHIRTQCSECETKMTVMVVVGPWSVAYEDGTQVTADDKIVCESCI